MSSELVAKIIAASTITSPHGLNIAIATDGTIGLFIGNQLLVEGIQASEEYLRLTDEQLAGLFNIMAQQALLDDIIHKQPDVEPEYLRSNVQPSILNDEHADALESHQALYTKKIQGLCTFLYVDLEEDAHVVVQEDLAKTGMNFQQLLSLAMQHVKDAAVIDEFSPVLTTEGEEKQTYIIHAVEDGDAPCVSALITAPQMLPDLTNELGTKYYILIADVDQLICMPIDITQEELKHTQIIVQVMRKGLDLASIGTDFCGSIYEYDNGEIKLISKGENFNA